MIMKFKQYLAVFCIALLLTTSCDTEDDKVKGEFSSGVLIVNEGNYKKGNSSVSFYNPSTGEIQQDLFSAKNDGRKLGDVAQSLTVAGDFAYIVVNNDNRVEVVNANTFVSSYTLDEGVLLPRYFTTYKGKGYLTEWVSFLDSGRVSVVNLSTRAIETTIKTDYGAENIIEKNGKLYVSNSFTTTVSVIDPAKNEVIKTIDVGSSPGAFVVEGDDKIWVVCSGGSDDNYNPLNDGALYRITTKTNEVDKTISLNKNVSAQLFINKKRNTLYYREGKKIFSIATSATAASTEPLINDAEAKSFYSFGYDAENDIIYAGDANGFSSNGTIYRYKSDGTKIDNFSSAGIGPNGFVFR